MTGLAIACASGGFRGAFVHGVLSALEARGFRADAYAGVSSTALPAATAAVGQISTIGIEHWLELLAARTSGDDMSTVILKSIDRFLPPVAGVLFSGQATRFLAVACAVTNPAATAETQGGDARKLGRRLLVAAARGNRDWAVENLEAVLFDSADKADIALTEENMADVLYASTRMLHAWSIPATVGGEPFVDGSYRLACPAVAMAEMGYRRVIAIGTQPGPIPVDIVGDTHLPEQAGGVPIETIVPEIDPAELKVDVIGADAIGLRVYYQHGQKKGWNFPL